MGLFCLFLSFLAVPARAQGPAENTDLFQGKILPLLAKNCHACHNPELKTAGLDLTTSSGFHRGAQSGPIFSPEDSEGSRILEVIGYRGRIKMPPTGKLSAEEIAELTEWIRSGASWPPGEKVAPSSGTRRAAEGEDDRFRIFEPVRRPSPPRVRKEDWVRSAVDRFVLAKLEREGLKPASPADKQTLLRRATFDLTGLPPTEKEVADFLADPSPGAYERVVDRLLGSSQYGERWGRHWLDVAGFAESQGFERDTLREHAWRYRDYVIESFNRDKPYHQFVKEQIAGDVIEPVSQEGIIATSFLVAGPWDEIGSDQPSELMRARIREEELEDTIGAVAQTFLGLTVNCARCHNHKFDPISQPEYYRMKAAFDGFHHGSRSVLSPSEARERRKRVAPLRERIARYYREINALEEDARRRVLRGRGLSQEPEKRPRPISRWTFDIDGKDSVGQLHFRLPEGASIERGRLKLHTRKMLVRTAPLSQPLREKTLEIWVSIPDLKQKGVRAMTVEHLSERVFDGIAFGGGKPVWGTGSEYGWRSLPVSGAQEETEPNEVVQIALVYSEDDRITLFRNGILYGSYLPETIGYKGDLQTFPAEASTIVFGRGGTTQLSAEGLVGELDEARLYDRALTAQEVAASFRAGAPSVLADELFGAMTEKQRRRRQRLIAKVRAAEQNLKRIPAVPMAYAGKPRQPGPTHILERGDPAKPGEQVTAGGLAAVRALPADFGLPADALEGLRRLKLAEWIAHPDNPLTARVMVNRVWHYHFGRGIVGTPNDFGVNGEPPSHPELLDWLAAEFQAEGWSLKKLHKRIMLSSTYRQSSRYNAKAAAVDAENRLLWRFAPRRLEGEAIRDAMLAVSGQLNPEVGGPGFRPFTLTINNVPFYKPTDPLGREYNRRTVYRMNVNSGKDPLLENLDCPDPSTKTPRRSVTTTPLQALSLMNNSFVLRQAKLLAERIRREVGGDPSVQIALAYRLALTRPANPAKVRRAAGFSREHGLEDFCWVLLNSNEFKYLE